MLQPWGSPFEFFANHKKHGLMCLDNRNNYKDTSSQDPILEEALYKINWAKRLLLKHPKSTHEHHKMVE